MATLQVIDRDGVSHDVECKPGLKVMEVLRELDYGVAAICGGMCSCATCHIYVDPAWADKLPPPMSDERDLLTELSHYRENSRLSCQVEITAALVGPQSHHRRRRVARMSNFRHLDVRRSPSSAASSRRWRIWQNLQQAAHAQERFLGRAAHRPAAQARLGSLQAARRGFLPGVSDAGSRRSRWRRDCATEGFDADVVDTPENGELRYSLHAHKSMQLTVPDMQELSRRLTDAAKEKEGPLRRLVARSRCRAIQTLARPV